MADSPQTCRYCGDTNVESCTTMGGDIPLCERHALDLRGRLLADLDRVAGLPVANPAEYRRGGAAPPAAPESSPQP